MSQSNPTSPLPQVDDMRVAIVRAEWNGHITSRLAEGALAVFEREGFDKDMVDVFDVPGAVELTFAASQLIESGLYDAIIVFGCYCNIFPFYTEFIDLCLFSFKIKC